MRMEFENEKVSSSQVSQQASSKIERDVSLQMFLELEEKSEK